MEGLLVAEVLDRLAPALPAERASWRFLDPYTFALPLTTGPVGALWLFNRPPDPRIELGDAPPPAGRSHSGFQDLLVARASGPLLRAEQVKLDRVLRLHFGAAGGFVEGEPATLVVELTGRNCNLILVDERERILGAAREVTAEVNRFRQVRPGLAYTPPPPYDKLDPRAATGEELAEALRGAQGKRVSKVVDGLGPTLTRALLARAGVAPGDDLEGGGLERVVASLRELAAAPSEVIEATVGLPDLAEVRERERRDALLARLRDAFGKRTGLLEKRLGDAERAEEAAEDAARLREEADLLMAYAHLVPEAADRVELDDFAGEPRTVALDPSLDARGNARSRYERAKKREARASAAAARRPEVERELAALRERVAGLDALDLARLAELADEVAPERKQERRRSPGVRYRGPHGFTVIVGRNARENDVVTFKLARSRDVWLHVQAYHGSHVVILAENREVPFDTLLFAAQLAAAYSKAAGGDNVPVDYTLRKNVWKVKGMPAGAVHFTQHKTVFVTPDRHPDGGEVQEVGG